MTLMSAVCTLMVPLYSMRPSFRNYAALKSEMAKAKGGVTIDAGDFLFA